MKNISKAISLISEITKHNEINQHSDLTNVGIQNVCNSIPRENYDQKSEKTTIQRGFKQTSRTNPAEVAIKNSERERAVEDNEMGKMLYQLVKQQSAPTVDIEEFDVNSLHYAYFRSMFQEVVEKRIADQQGRLTRLIKLTTGERHIVTEETVWEPIQVVGMLQNRNKQSKIKPEDAAACRRLFNFLIKC